MTARYQPFDETESDVNNALPLGQRLHESRMAALEIKVAEEQLAPAVKRIHAQVVQHLVKQHLADPSRPTLAYKTVAHEDTANFNVWLHVLTKLQVDDKFRSASCTYGFDNSVTIVVEV